MTTIYNRYRVLAGMRITFSGKATLKEAYNAYLETLNAESDCIVSLAMFDLTTGQYKVLCVENLPK